MFSPQIVGSDAFLDMPISTQALYFHLGMYADDDGFINPKKIMRMAGASDDDLKILLAKRFALAFEDGIVVIKHWLINNLIQGDRYRPTIYEENKKLIKIKENRVYTESVNKMLPQYRLGKDRLGKDSEEGEAAALPPTPREIASRFFSENTEQESVISKLIENGMPENIARGEIQRFVDYWIELNPTGKKQRWEMQKTFEVQRRLATWFRNTTSYQNKNVEKPRGMSIIS